MRAEEAILCSSGCDWGPLRKISSVGNVDSINASGRALGQPRHQMSCIKNDWAPRWGRPYERLRGVTIADCRRTRRQGHGYGHKQAAVWPESFVEEANLTVSVSALRKVLGERPGEKQYIDTIPKKGYRFVATVSEAPGY